MARLKAVFFDLGGTLMEETGDLRAKVEALVEVNARYRIPMSGEQTLRWFLRDLGPYYAGQPERWIPIRDHLRRNFVAYLQEYGRKADEDDCEWFEATYDAFHVKRCTLFPDALPVVRRVRGLGLHVGLLTDVDEKFVRPVLDAVGLAPHLDSVTTSEAVGVGKPNPRIFRAALDKAGCRPPEAVLVGDSARRDVEGAKAVGMRAIFLSPVGDKAAGADATVRSLPEAAGVIEGWLHE